MRLYPKVFFTTDYSVVKKTPLTAKGQSKLFWDKALYIYIKTQN